MITVGTKVYKYDDDKNIIMYRYFGNKDGSMLLKLIKGPKTEPKRLMSTEDGLNEDGFLILNADAFMNIMITSTTFEEKIIKDVYACVHKGQSLLTSNDPDLVVKQNCVSTAKNMFSIMGGDVYIGDCLTKDTLPTPDMKISDMFDYKAIDYGYSIALYLEDTVGDIMGCINKETLDKVEEALEEIRVGLRETPQIKGCSKDFQSLLNDNGFMTAYRSIFNITQLDFVIDIGVNHNSEGDIVFNKKQHKLFEEFLRQHVTIDIILKYDKDIDIANIITRTHGMFSDKNGEIYLIAYTVLSEILDDDIAKAFNV